MRSVAVLSRKGGSGKSTLALHLAVVAQADGERVLLVDADPQRSAAEWWRSRRVENPELVEAEEGQLQSILAAAATDGVTLVIIDTAPHAERTSAEAAASADLVMIPCRPGILDLRAIAGTVAILRAARASGFIVLNGCPPVRDGEASLTREARQALQTYELPVAPISITQRASFAHALIDGQAVTEFDPAGRAAAEIQTLWQWTKEYAPWRNAQH